MKKVSLAAALLVGFSGFLMADVPAKEVDRIMKDIEQLSKNDQVLEKRIVDQDKTIGELKQFRAHAEEMIATLKKSVESNSKYFVKVHDEQRVLKKDINKRANEPKDTKGDAATQELLKEQNEKIATMNKDIDALFSKLLEVKSSSKGAKNPELEATVAENKEKIGTINKDVDELFSKLLELKGTVSKIQTANKPDVKAFEQKEKTESTPVAKEEPKKEEPKAVEPVATPATPATPAAPAATPAPEAPATPAAPQEAPKS